MGVLGFVLNELQHDAGFTDTGVADYDEFEEVMVGVHLGLTLTSINYVYYILRNNIRLHFMLAIILFAWQMVFRQRTRLLRGLPAA